MTCTTACHSPHGRQAHCGAAGCHLTFNAVSTFDAHRRGGVCHTDDMTEKNGVWGNWGSMSPAHQARLRGGS